MINKFREEYFFLSNFYNANVFYNGFVYPNNEAAFQAQKVIDPKIQEQFTNLQPKEAKRKGRNVKLRDDWEIIKEQIMYEICLAKFMQNPDLAEKLLATGNSYLEESNTWSDRTWGTVNGKGQNKLGKILMKVRSQIRYNKLTNELLIRGVSYD